MSNFSVGTGAGKGGDESPLSMNASMKPVRMAEIDFSGAPLVQGIGFRIIIPVPDLGLENQDLTVKNWKGEKELIRGYGFRNGVDAAQQAVVGDGTGVIIVAINPEQLDVHKTAGLVVEKIAQLGGAEALRVGELNELMKFINDLGVTDIYNSTDSGISSMVAVGEPRQSGRPLGLFEKQEKAGPLAVFVPGGCSVLDGPHAGTATYPEGFVAIRIPPKKEGEEPSFRSVAPSAVGYCYQLADGERITDPAAQLPHALS